MRQADSLQHVTHLGVAERPHDGVDDQLELRRRHREQRLEAVPRDGVQQAEELQPVLRVVLRSRDEVKMNGGRAVHDAKISMLLVDPATGAASPPFHGRNTCQCFCKRSRPGLYPRLRNRAQGLATRCLSGRMPRHAATHFIL